MHLFYGARVWAYGGQAIKERQAMSIFTVVDEGYEVEVYRSFTSLWHMVNSNYPTATLDQKGNTRLTRAALQRELRQGIAWVYAGDDSDWYIKIQRQS